MVVGVAVPGAPHGFSGWQSGCADCELTMTVHAPKLLTPEEFASLLAIGSVPVNGLVPAIPAAHRARLIALGYMADIQGRLRMTTPGRYLMYAGQIAS